MPTNTESPWAPAGQVPTGGWSAAMARVAKPGSASAPTAPRLVRMKSRRPLGAVGSNSDILFLLVVGFRIYIVERSYPSTILRRASPPSIGENPVLLKKAERRYRLHTSDYARLAAFRGQLREFLRFSEDAAAAVGLTAQHYQAMLELRAAPDGAQLSINDLAGKLLIRHNSAVGLVDRL